METFFVSGHLDLSKDEFQAQYEPMLRLALELGAKFVVGDARGTDLMVQEFLKAHQADVTVYHMFERPRFNAGFPTIGGYSSDEERDEAMTLASTRDIAWVRPGRESSGTAKNLRRRSITPRWSTPVELKEGDKSRALCPFCEGLRETTFRVRSVPLSNGEGVVPDALVGVCDSCGNVVSIPQQSVPQVKAAIGSTSQ